MILTIYGDVESGQPSSWIFFPKGLAYDFGLKFQISCNFVVKMDLEVMPGDVFG